jgi:hypothetical protein
MCFSDCLHYCYSVSHHSEEALKAHGAAAQRILHDNNAARGRGAAELDLHGLHASEAVAALDAHLQGA